MGVKLGYKKASANTPAAKNLGARLRKARRYEFLSLRDVAESLGVDRSFVIRTESGDRVPDIVELTRLAGVLKLDISELMLQIVADLQEHSK